jgi:NAD(P)-dependent dehydrogenase (short-subunit alcohol dehydrogenase family)
LLRPGLLKGVAVLVAGPSEAHAGRALGVEVGETCTALEASVSTCSPHLDLADVDGEAALQADIAAAVEGTGGLDMLAVDGASLFSDGLARGGSGHLALRACVDGAWNVTRAAVNHAFLTPAVAVQQSAEHPDDGPAAPRGGRIVYLAPAPDTGEHAPAACAGLENLARTLSVEWARYGITTVTIAPGAGTGAGEVATLVAYLASPAGAYFSGCLLDLRGP